MDRKKYNWYEAGIVVINIYPKKNHVINDAKKKEKKEVSAKVHKNILKFGLFLIFFSVIVVRKIDLHTLQGDCVCCIFSPQSQPATVLNVM